MAERAKGRKLKKVTKTFQVQGGALRESAGVTIQKSGRGLTNAEGGDLMIGLAKAAGADPTRFQVSFGVDEETQIIGVEVVPPGTPGSMPARPSGDERMISFHLGAVFDEYPALRPVGKRQYMVYLESDENGVLNLMIDLKSGVIKRVGGRDAAGAQSQAAATKQA